MGQGTSAYDQSELAEFQDLTYFTKREVLQWVDKTLDLKFTLFRTILASNTQP